MPRHKEPISGGLWTAMDPAILEPGQLQDARNSLYLSSSKALHRAPGREVFGAVSAVATAVVGLRDIQFDNSDQYLIALAGSTLKTAPIGDTGTFTTLTALPATASQLESAHHRNRFYLFNGSVAASATIGSNQVVYLSATAAGGTPQTRQHGMRPVTEAPVSASAAATFSLTVTGYYEYWVTEVARLTQDGAVFEMESTFAGTPATIYVSSTTYSPTITKPTIQNPGITTHWRVYRSPKKDTVAEKQFPAGFEVATVATATAQITDGGSSVNTGYVFPSLFNAAPDIFADAVNASGLAADGGSEATIATLNDGGGGSSVKAQGCYGFNFGGFSGAVVGLEIEVQGYVSIGTAPVSVAVDIGVRDAGGLFKPINSAYTTNWGPGRSFLITSTSSGSPTTVVLGSPTDPWTDPPLPDTDFGANFMVRLYLSRDAARTVSFDYVKARVYHSGATRESANIQFPTVVYTFGDITSQVGKNGQPPTSTTGDVYEDQLVVNDVSNAALIRYSYPGDPDAFPETYFVDFETPQNDIVRVIRVVNDRLVVWLASSTWRVNYLPSERDASFDRGKSKSPVSLTYGCIDPMCVAVFSPGGGQDIAAFVSHHGIHGTDGYSFDSYTEGLDWSLVMPRGASSPIALINDRERSLLLYYFQNTTNFGSETFLCLALAYGEGHWQGKPKVCGFTHMRNHSGGVFASLESAWAAQRQNGKVSVYLGYGGADTAVGAGKVYLETGTSNPALDPRLQYVTREMCLADYGNEWVLGDLYGYAHGYGATVPTLSYTIKKRKTNDTALTTGSSRLLSLAGQKLHKAGSPREMVEAASVTVVATASALACEFLLIDGEGWGQESAGRS